MHGTASSPLSYPHAHHPTASMHTARATPSDSALSAQHIGVCIGHRTILHGISLELAAARWTAIIGPNGAGKSTLLRVLAGLQPAYVHTASTSHSNTPPIPYTSPNTSLKWWNTPLHTLTPRQRARRMAWLGQAESTAPDLRVWDVVMLGRLPHQGWLAVPSAHDIHAVEQALHTVHGLDWRMRTLGELSGGERQRVLLARALATQADLLLMDEPLMHLDPPHQADWLHIVRSLVQQGKTVVSVLHEINMALQADDLVMLRHGHLHHCGSTASPDSHRALEALFDQRLHIYPLHQPDTSCHTKTPPPRWVSWIT